MKHYLLFFFVGTLILSSCSTGNFAKRKYTKGRYTQKKDHSIAKNDKNKEDNTNYVVKTEKNKTKQSYKVTKAKTLKKSENATANEVASVEKRTVSKEEVSANNNVLLEDNISEENNLENNNIIVEEENQVVPAKPLPDEGDKALAAEILGYIGFGLGLLAFVFASLGWLIWSFAYTGLFFGILALGASIASWVMGGQTVWNLWGVIASAIAIALATTFLILWFAGAL